MMRITDRNKVPRHGYTFTQVETGRQFSAHTPPGLFHKVREYQVANSLRVWTDLEIEEDYCRRNPEQCNDGTPRQAPVEHDDMLTRLGAAVGIPAANALSKLAAKLGIKCQSCNRRHQIIRSVRQIGFEEALRQLKETL